VTYPACGEEVNQEFGHPARARVDRFKTLETSGRRAVYVSSILGKNNLLASGRSTDKLQFEVIFALVRDVTSKLQRTSNHPQIATAPSGRIYQAPA
jgi:hypothetical protein